MIEYASSSGIWRRFIANRSLRGEGFSWDGSRRAYELLKDGFEMQKGFGLRRIFSDHTIDILNELLKNVPLTLHGLHPSRRAIIDYCCDLRPTNTSNNERVRLRLAGYP